MPRAGFGASGRGKAIGGGEGDIGGLFFGGLLWLLLKRKICKHTKF